MEEKIYNLGDKNIKICLLTDLHFSISYDYDVLNKILENVKINKPDFICLSGDIIDSSNVLYSNSIDILKEFIKNLAKISQVIISLGNHEISNFKNNGLNKEKKPANIFDVINWFMELNKIENVYFLNNKNLVRGDICFIGYNPDYEYYKKEDNKLFIKDLDSKIQMNKKYFNILLCHSPINVFSPLTLKYSKEIKKANLILSGHMHNGMILRCFDFGGNWGLISPLKKPLPKYARNKATKKIDNKEVNLIISGGIIKFSSVNSKIIQKLNCLFKPSIVYINI
ncbi:MAG: metallophosphoesterase [Bacilli bacterium]|nr:metallophosphoesterase [Bacilli bacterium]